MPGGEGKKQKRLRYDISKVGHFDTSKVWMQYPTPTSIDTQVAAVVTAVALVL